MNKLPTIAFSLLLLSGVALWYLASDSLNFYIKNKIETIGAKVTGQTVLLDNVTILTYQGKGTLSNLVISAQSEEVTSSSKSPILSIGSIELTFDPKSLKDEVIIISDMKITQLTANITYVAGSSSINQLNNQVSLALKQSHVTKSKLPQKFKITQVTIQNVQLFEAVNEEPTLKANEMASVKLMQTAITDIGGEEGLDAHLLGTVVFQALLNELEISLQ